MKIASSINAKGLKTADVLEEGESSREMKELCPIFEEESRSALVKYPSDREIPDVVKQLFLEAHYKSSYSACDKHQLQIEDALIPLNDLIKQQEKAAYNAGSVLEGSDADIESTPCPPMAEIRKRRKRREFRQIGGISRSEVLDNLAAQSRHKLAKWASNSSECSVKAGSRRPSLLTSRSCSTRTVATAQDELETSEKKFETASTKRHGVLFDSLIFRPLELDLLRSVYS